MIEHGEDITQPNEDRDFFGEPSLKTSDFKIGDEFKFDGMEIKHRVTDIGTRTIAYITLDHEDDPSWYNGPPYAVMENVLAQEEMKGVSKI